MNALMALPYEPPVVGPHLEKGEILGTRRKKKKKGEVDDEVAK
jgi:hypothetical protein